MYAERLGSYSMCATRAGTPSLRRLKSIRRYRRLAPPPRWRAVLRPLELRPPLFLSPSVSDFSGSPRVISAKSGYITNRRPAEVGLGLRIGISRASPRSCGKKPSPCDGNIPTKPSFATLQSAEDRNRLARADLDDRLLPAPRAPGGVAPPLGLGLHPGRAHVHHADVEQLLDRLPNLRLVGVVVDAEDVLAGLGQGEALLGDDGADDHLGGLHHSASRAASGSLSAAGSPERDRFASILGAFASRSSPSRAPTRSGLAARATSVGSAASLTSSDAAPTMSATPASSTGSATAWRRLRKDFPASASPSVRITRVGVGAPQSDSREAARAVAGTSNREASNTASDPRPACSESAERSAARRSLRLTLKV